MRTPFMNFDKCIFSDTGNAARTSALRSDKWGCGKPLRQDIPVVHNETHYRLPARQTGGAALGLKAVETLEAARDGSCQAARIVPFLPRAASRKYR